MISQVLLKLLAKLLTVCVIFADHTRLVMQDVAQVLWLGLGLGSGLGLGLG